MSDSTCPNCNATIPSGAAFCTNCGHRMDADTSSSAAAPATEDATRVESPGLHDSTQVIPPSGEQAAASAPWQPSASSAPPSSEWSAAPPAAPPSGEQQSWGQPQSPPAPQGPPSGSWQQPAAPAGQPAWGAPQQGGASAPAWGTPAPSGASGDVEPSPAGGGAALGGGVLAAIGLFIGWFKLSAGDLSETYSGWDLATSDTSPFESSDPYLLLVAALVGIAAGVLLFMGKMRPIAASPAVVAGRRSSSASRSVTGCRPPTW